MPNMTRDNYVRVFFSHKSDDRDLAIRVRGILERDCHNLRCYVSGDGFGEDWRDTVETELTHSDVLFLLFTNPGKDWDWPLYEAGLFAPREGEDQRAIIYFHLGAQRPAPLQHLVGSKYSFGADSAAGHGWVPGIS